VHFLRHSVVHRNSTFYRTRIYLIPEGNVAYGRTLVDMPSVQLHTVGPSLLDTEVVGWRPYVLLYEDVSGLMEHLPNSVDDRLLLVRTNTQCYCAI